MSLINQMLKDLERRSGSSYNKEIILSGLPFSYSETTMRDKRPYFLLILFLLFSLFIFTALHYRHIGTHQKLIEVINSKPINNNQANTKNESTEPLDFALEPSILTGITIQVQQNTTFLRFLLNQETLYTLSSDGSQEVLTIHLEKTQLSADIPPINYIHGAIKNISMSAEKNGDLKIILSLNPGVSIKHLELNETEKLPELQIDLFSNPIQTMPTESQKFDSVKKPVSEFNMQERYQQILHISAAGQSRRAIKMLAELLQQYPDFLEGRETLAALLLQQGDFVGANDMIETGLQQQPFYPPLIKIKAQILVRQGKISQALNLLQMAAPSLKSDPNYHAFIAALYQRQGHFMLAAKLYEQLLTLQPGNSVWWMGLGVTLENMGNHSEALEAYSHATRTGSLTPELRAFVDSRLQG